MNKYSLEIEYNGKWPSVNTLRNNRWDSNQGLKNKLRRTFSLLVLEQKPKKMAKFRVDVRYNSRLDPDNVSLKYFVDSLKDIGIIIDDNKKFFKGLSVEPDESLKYMTYIVKVTEVYG